MCGIAGVAALGDGRSPTEAQIAAMCRTMIYRGPDDQGVDVRDGVGLGMRRLSIIDIAGGQQPMFNEDGSVRTVLNGEIYNFRELRAELEAKGHRFATNSDTEVIVHAYEQYGADFPRRLNGMFAFAVHDSRRRKLLLARDHVGIKPLYYAFCPPYLIWGSELKVLLASGLVPRDLDLDAAAQFFAWEYVPGEATLLRSVRKLLPGHLIEIDLDNAVCRPREYWDVPDVPEDDSLTEGEWIEQIDATLAESVRRQLVSDVPLGAFFSGGVDSSLIVASMGRATTFSIGFNDPSYNELGWARQVAAHLGLDHHERVIRPEVIDLFGRLMNVLDDPIGDFSIFPTFLVSQLAREHVSVVLSGDGGDEPFGGYEAYLANGMAARYRFLPGRLRRGLIEPVVNELRPRPVKKGLINKAKRFVEGLSHPEALGHARWRVFDGNGIRQSLFAPEARTSITTPAEQHIFDLARRASNRQPLNRSLYVDLKSYLCDNILVKVDRMSMAVSLEARVPFLDPEVVELAFRVPERFKIDGKETKSILKKVAARHIPSSAVYRPKEGFSIPIKNWLKAEFRPLVEDYLDPVRIEREGVFDGHTIARLKAEHLSDAANHSHVLWSLIVFQAWRSQWLDSFASAPSARSELVPA